MALPQFTTRQLLVYVTWMGVGFGGIAFSLRSWHVARAFEDDYRASLEPLTRVTAFVLGWIAVCAAVVSLIAAKKGRSVLLATLVMTLPFSLFIANDQTSSFSSDANLGPVTPIVGGFVAILGSIEAGRMMENREARSNTDRAKL